MAYTIYKSNGTAITVADNTIDTMFYNPSGGSAGQGMGLQLVGRNTLGYGSAIAQNILQSAENFASSVVPADAVALQGQLWFNTTSNSIYVRTGISGNTGGLANWNQISILDHNGNLSVPGTISSGGGPVIPVVFATEAEAIAGVNTLLSINPAVLVPTIKSFISSVPTVNITGGVAGSLPYQTATNETGFVAPSTNGDILTLVNGDPVWASNSALGGVTQVAGGANIAVSSATGGVTISVTGTVPNATIASYASNAGALSGQPSSYFQPALGFQPVQQGGGTGQSGNKIYIGWAPSGSLLLQVDSSNFGNVWPISITGNANTATNATNAANATNATNANYATTAGNANTLGGSTLAQIESLITNSGIGAGQTWQNVTSSRVVNMVYRNTTSTPIQVLLQVDYTYSVLWYFTVGGVTTMWYGSGPTGVTATTSFIVPVGVAYSATGFSSWFELR